MYQNLHSKLRKRGNLKMHQQGWVSNMTRIVALASGQGKKVNMKSLSEICQSYIITPVYTEINQIIQILHQKA